VNEHEEEQSTNPTPQEWADGMRDALSMTDLRRFHSGEAWQEHIAPGGDAWKSVMMAMTEMVFHGLAHEGFDRESPEAQERVPVMLLETAFLLGRAFQETEVVRLAKTGQMNHLYNEGCTDPTHNHSS